ncbi:polyketide synthase/peptide synthetase [Colletotrichum salicis]|uniref:Polyketide synthase/peptide synthetase n=1 Tax=Colletotrichum salicis TaxID=1209931 RepID=A0A135U6S7_9PEZI|nr:polyketide synthase/peptide synthetase [Colletotrichum salicis]
MEVVYESLEASGMSMGSMAGSRTGVYVGLMCADYAELVNSDVNALPTYTPTGNARSIMSNRISYFFDWHGPTAAGDPFDFAVEVGPHATLKGPALQTLQEVRKDELPYTGLLSRGKDDVRAFSDALGYLWSQFSPSVVDFRAFDSLASRCEDRKMMYNLPTYHWDHDTIFWHKSRATKAFLSQRTIPHPLLGTRTTDVMDEQIRWKNQLLLSELPWIRGHQLQGQVIYPATAYLSTAVEAAMLLIPEGANASVLEIQDFNLGKPLVFGEDGAGIETVFTLSDISKSDDKTFSASFIYHASGNPDMEHLSTHATGRVIVTIGETSSHLLASQNKDLPNLVTIPEDRFYKSLETVGYGYSGYFKTMSSIKRKLNFSSSKIRVPPQDQEEPGKMLLHPAVLDTALQGIFLAYCWPGDGSLDQLHVPTGIRSCRVNVGLCQQSLLPDTEVSSCSLLTGNPLATRNLNGDVEISTDEGICLVQMEGLKVVSFAEQTMDADRAVFTEYVWDVLAPNCERAMGERRATAEDYDLAYAIERVSVHYMKQLATLFPEALRSTMNLEWHYKCLFNFVTDVLSTTEAGQRKTAKKEWLQDSAADIEELKAKHAHTVDMQLARAVGDNLPAVLRGETTMLEHLTKDNLLDRFYEVGLGLKEFSGYLRKTVEQVVHRHPRMKMLEIGAGTGGATKVIMRGIGRAFSSYTYTDISPNFFETASEVFGSVADKIIFKTLDVEKDIVQQGYEEYSYDLVVASLVLHATTDLKRTLNNTRRLLKPGGYLIIQEVCNNEPIRTGFMMCALPGWWLGQDDGRTLPPCVSTPEWNDLLVQTGFSGVDSATHELDSVPFQLAVIVSQAIDDRVSLLREPLALVGEYAPVDEPWDLLLVGGRTVKTIQLIQEIVGLIHSSSITHTLVKAIDDIVGVKISPTTAIVCLEDLDEPVFKGISEGMLEGLKRLFETQRTVLWVTQGCRSADPYMNMSVGLGRTLILENSDLVLQFLDLETGIEPDPRRVLEALLRLRQSDRWERKGEFDDVLWTNEHELAYDNGELCLSRVHLAEPLNNRFNASKRTVIETRNLQTTPLSLSLGSASKHSLVLDDALEAKTLGSLKASKFDSEVLIKVTHSLLMPDLTTTAASCLILGKTTEAMKRTVLAISENNGSHALVSSEELLDVEVPAGKESVLLSHIHNQLQVDSMLSICGKDDVLAIHEPHPDIASILIERSSEANIPVHITTTSPVDSTWTKVDAYSSRSVVKSLLSPDISVFVDCSVGGQSQRAGSLIASCLPQACLKTTIACIPSLRRIRGFSVVDLHRSVKKLLQKALKEVSTSVISTLRSVRVDQLADDSSVAPPAAPAIMDWSTATEVSVQISTVDSHVAFKSDRTYVLFGLTSDLAQSICDWMVTHGARNIVLTSRNPKIDAKWEKLLTEAGVRVEVFSNDITDKEALVSLVRQIRRSFPPIAGIAHDAMVLDDAPTLDFCIFFSSCTAIAGNRGQSAYTAANMFMSSLASQRREKGLAGSILHIGAVMGVGYINRGFKDYIFTALSRAGYMMVSEREFHLCFGEAVLASHPESGRNPDVVTALETAEFGDTPPLWAKFPRFQYCLAAESGAVRQTQQKQTASLSTKLRLAEATTAEEVLQVVQDSFFQKLRVVLQIPNDTDKTQGLASGTDDLGIDSLVAVEIRSWFLKEIDTEIAVFKVLSGISIAELVEFAVESMPAGLTPNINDSHEAPLEPDALVVLSPPPPVSVSSVPSSPPNTTAEASQQLSEESSSTSQPDDKQDETRDPSDASLNRTSEITYEKVLPVSPGQSRFWFLKHLMEDQTTANNTILVSIRGTVRLDNLDSAVRKVAARHESLRTSFFMDENQKPVQAVSETSRLYLETKTLGSESKVGEEFDVLKRHVYDIEHGECMRLVHLGITAAESYLLIGSHHIVMDGVSLEVFLNDVQKAYNGQSLSDLVYQYSDYSEKLHQELDQGTLQNQIEYWKSEFAEAPSPLPLLPFADVKQRRSLTAYDHISVGGTVDPKVAKQVSETCRQLKANVFHFYLGVFEVLLHKLLGTSDVCIGMADANRWDHQVSQSIGMYLNLLPLRFSLDAEQSFEAVLKNTRKKAYLAMSSSRLPFDVLLDNLKCERSTAFSPLFQAFINYRQGVRENRMLGTATCATKEISLPRAGYDMSLDIIENPGGDTRLVFMLQRALYSEKETSQMLEMYYNLLSELSSLLAKVLQEVSLFTSEDIDNAVQLGQGPVLQSQWPETLANRINAMIGGRPKDVSLRETDGNTWTWEKLGEEVNRVSSAMLQANIKSGSKVAVYQQASPSLIFSLLAILRIGAVYVPLDCSLPEGRLRQVLTECKPSGILLDGTTFAQSGSLGLPPSVTALDVSNLTGATTPVGPVTVMTGDAAAVLFTSGSTGVPKGVILSHGSLRNHLEALIYTHGFGRETVLQQSSVGFDMSLNQIFMALANGGTLVIVPESLRKDSSAVAKIVLEQNITYTSATPSEYLAWARHGSDSLLRSNSWRFATAGGEQFTPQLLEVFQKLKTQFQHPFHVFNAYGPTECSMSSHELEVNLEAPPTTQKLLVGSSLPNCATYIIDENSNPLPVGFPGEICISGAGVALGYLNNANETANKFLENPRASASAKEQGWDRMYRTGDKGILMVDGALEVLGRIEGDTQIKLRGLRIEMQDIEQPILDASEGRLGEVIVTPRGDPTILVAHAVISPSAWIEIETEYLRDLSASLPLPQYMRPAAIIPIVAMPLNPSGKIDRGSLQKLDLPSGSTQNKEPTRRLTETESKLAQVWKEVLPQQLQDVHVINEATDFFQVGGNSMLLIELRQVVKKRFQADLQLLRLFESSTLGAMAAAIRNLAFDERSPVDWDTETKVPRSWAQLNVQQAPVQSLGSQKNIVVSGATGFLGNSLMRLLVEAPNVNKIHCIAVRNGDKLAEFAGVEKVDIYYGNLTQPRCGLSESEAAFIFDSADVVVHNGADVSFLKSYSSLRASNVLSTKELVKLAIGRRTPFHYISTVTVGKLNRSDTLARESLASFPPEPTFADGYAASKWASEVFLEKVTRQFGLPTFIHRPSSITGSQAGENDIMSNILKYSALIKALPDSSRWSGSIDLISVEKAAAAIIGSVLDERRDDTAAIGVEYLHHAGEKVVPAHSIKAVLSPKDEVEWESLAMHDWVDRAVESGMNPLVGEFLRSTDKGQGLQIGQNIL